MAWTRNDFGGVADRASGSRMEGGGDVEGLGLAEFVRTFPRRPMGGE